ncbi:MAG: DNA polymerase IV [Longispora sp.]|nr:DNA polymerase IV [Longispora sp. (in: high G+C Gram-positive bacteria)]
MGRQFLPPERDPPFGLGADDADCPILHVDMDAFFASVELRRRPHLRGQPVVVGGLGPRGVVSAASYEARHFGVRSAMPMSQARRACPQAVFLPPDLATYRAVSQAVMAMFRDLTPLVEPLSVDEAFLDVRGAVRLFGSPSRIAQDLRARVSTELGLTCSVGVGPNKFLSKLASSRAKPDGLVVVPSHLILEFLHPLPIAALWGVGERTAEVLRRLGLSAVRDVAQAPSATLRKALGEVAGRHIAELAWGRDPRRVHAGVQEKSISAEITFDVDVHDPQALRRTLLGLAEKTSRRLRTASMVGRTIGLKVRFSDFNTISRSRTLPAATDVTREVFESIWQMYTALGSSSHAGRPIRLIGVRIEGLVAASGQPRQLALGEAEQGWREADQVTDAVVSKFGSAALRPASLLQSDSGRKAQRGTDTDSEIALATRDEPKSGRIERGTV